MANHDEYSLWFDVLGPAAGTATPGAAPPPSACVLPMSRLRLGEVNNAERNSLYAAVLRRLLHQKGEQQQEQHWVLALGDQSLLGLMAAKLANGSRVVVASANQHMQQLLHQLAEINGVKERADSHEFMLFCRIQIFPSIDANIIP